MIRPIKKTIIVTIGIYLIIGLFHDVTCRAESKSELIKRLRNQSCTEDVSRSTAQIARLEQMQADITQLLKSMEIASLPAATIEPAHSAEATLIGLSAALKNHSQSKQTICARLNPDSGPVGGFPEGYKGLSKSERIERLKADYCKDVQQNGESIRTEIPILKATMEKMLKNLSTQASLNAPMGQIQKRWSELIPIVDELYSEQMMASEICKSLTQGISKSELIRKSKQGLEEGGQLPHFWYLITYD